MPDKHILKNILQAVAFSLFMSLFFYQAYALEVIQGRSSWYGPGFHTRTTANGEKYDMYGMSAAHKKLPFGTILRVTNLANNRTTVVRVNDRGPVAPILTIDLSYSGAKALNMLNSGTAKVKIEIVGNKKGLHTTGETFFLNLDDSLIDSKQNQSSNKQDRKEEKAQISFSTVKDREGTYTDKKIKKNLEKLYSAGIQEATQLLLSVDNNLCIGPFETLSEAEKYYFRISTLYPHASIWLKPEKNAKQIIPSN